MKNMNSTALAALALSLSVMAANAQNYDVIDLGTLGGIESESRGLNSQGKVVGYSLLADGNAHAFYWDGVQMRDLGTLGGRESNARCINAAGVMAGRADINYWTQHAVRWEGNQKLDLGTLGGLQSSAYGINSANQIVGWADTSTGATRAFRWQSGQMSDLGTLGGVSSWARAINESSDVAGYSFVSGGAQHAFLLRGQQMTDLGTLGGPNSWAYDLNDAAAVVGESHTAQGPAHACLWDQSGAHDLGTFGGSTSAAWGVNNQNQVVGYADTATQTKRAFLWQNGQMLALNDLISPNSGWNLKEAMDINDNGVIVGRGTINGETHAFVLLPNGSNMLVLGGPTPGIAGQSNTFTVDGGTPASREKFFYSLRSGTTTIPGCPNITLSLQSAVAMGTATADQNGHAQISVTVPGNARGVLVLFQAYEGDTCRVTNRVSHTFQ